MSGGHIKVGFAEIAHASSEITSGATQVDRQLSDLMQQVQKTLAAWEGANSDNYKQAQDKWHRAASDLQAVMAAIGTAVQQAGEAYQQAEQKNAARW